MAPEEQWAAENGGFHYLIKGWLSVDKIALRELVEERNALEEALRTSQSVQDGLRLLLAADVSQNGKGQPPAIVRAALCGAL